MMIDAVTLAKNELIKQQGFRLEKPNQIKR